MKTILLVDDEESTRIFVHFTLKHLTTDSVDLHHVRDGVQAMRYLEGYAQYADRRVHPFPDLVLLDIKMPLVDGFEVLQHVRSQQHLEHLPIVILTESTDEASVTHALKLGANAFATKTVDLAHFEHELQHVLENLLFPSPAATQLAS